jgi:hypothetical protein
LHAFVASTGLARDKIPGGNIYRYQKIPAAHIFPLSTDFSYTIKAKMQFAVELVQLSLVR